MDSCKIKQYRWRNRTTDNFTKYCSYTYHIEETSYFCIQPSLLPYIEDTLHLLDT